MLKAIAGSAVVIGAFNAIRNSIGGAISRFDTLNNFPRVMELMGFSAEESEKAIKKLADGIDGLPTALDEVTGTAQRLATMTGDLDGAVETTLALNNAFLASGASTADASRGLEQYVQMLATGTVDLQSWRTLQETMPIALNKVAEAFGYTGRSAQNDLYEALKSGEITFDEFNNKLIELSNETGGFADMAREGSTGIATSWQNIRTAIVKGVADVIGVIDESLASFGGISGVMDTVKSGIQTFFNFVVTNLPIAIDWLKSVVDTVREWLPAFDEGKNYLQEVFTTIWDIAVPIFQEVVNFIMTIWGNLVSWWQEHGEMISQAVQNFMTVILAVMRVVWPIIQFLVVDTWEAIKGVIQGAIDVITGIIEFFAALFTGNWSALWGSIKKILSGAVQFIWNFIQLSFVGKIVKLVKGFAKTFINVIKDKWDTVRLVFMYAIDFVKGLVSRGFGVVRNSVTTIMNAIRSVISTVWNRIRSVVTSVVNTIRNVISNVFNSLRSIVSNAFNKVSSAVKTGINNAYNAVKNKIKDFYNAGKNIVTSIADGIKNAVGKVTDAISGVTQKIRNFLPFSPAKEGALRDIMDIQIAQSIAQAIDKGKNVAVRSMANLTDALYGEMPQVDIAGQVRNIHSQSQRQMNFDFSNELKVNRQPAQITLVLGNREFEAFVEDINEVNAVNATLRRF
ncbi:phage tail protein [Aeribacillus composti]|uniref:Tape measure protein N-terminal domain-containing protein n=1 Tax=Anoxybacillus phage A403 TaxID=2099336 RepID=A0A2P1JTW1_9CAUD|nr:hypothetical protein HWB56_gp05 [Anoxybacillus phage A403]AVO22573.1 hypothetical protein [Anoxybacillus phage A403]